MLLLHPEARPEPSKVGSPLDPRRSRAAFVTVLKAAAENGDSLLGHEEALKMIAALDLERPYELGVDWALANKEILAGTVEIVELPSGDPSGPASAGIQLTVLKQREERLRKVLESRAARRMIRSRLIGRHYSLRLSERWEAGSTRQIHDIFPLSKSSRRRWLA